MQFVQNESTLPSSRRRIVSLWFGNANRTKLMQTEDFTGTVIVTTLYTVEGQFRYFVCFYTLGHQIIEIWKTNPETVPISSAPAFEKELFDKLSQLGLDLVPIFEDSKDFASVLMYLPMAFNDENETAPAVNALTRSQDATFTLSEKEKKLFRELFIQL